jgi:hypothetical protein
MNDTAATKAVTQTNVAIKMMTYKLMENSRDLLLSAARAAVG